MSGGSFESSQRTEPVCATRFSSIKNCFKTQASGLARGRGWSRIGHSARQPRRPRRAPRRPHADECAAGASRRLEQVDERDTQNKTFAHRTDHTSRLVSARQTGFH